MGGRSEGKRQDVTEGEREHCGGRLGAAIEHNETTGLSPLYHAVSAH